MKKMILVLSSVLLLSGCGSQEGKVVARKEIPLVKVASVMPGRKFVESTAVQGTVRTKESTVVSARIPGTIDRLMVEEGTFVKAGTPLFQVDLENLTNAVRLAEDDLRVCQAKLEEAESVEGKARADDDRMRRLVAAKAVTVDAAERADVKLKNATAAIKAVKAQIARAETTLLIAKKNLSDSVVCAPFDGMLVKKLKNAGDYVAPGMGVFNMDNTGCYEICFSVDDAFYALVEPGKTFVGEWPVTYKSPNVSPVSRTFEIRVQIPKDGNIAPGMLVKTRLVLREFTADALPDAAVNRQHGQDMVYIVEDGHVRALELSPGFSSDGFRALKSGEIPAGAKVVSDGMLLLNDGDEVRVKEE